MQTRKRSYDYGPGKENYAKIAQAFDAQFGDPYVGMSDWWRNPQQWADFMRLEGVSSRGIIPQVKALATNPDGSPVPESDWPDVLIPSFGPFTGAQHELGGNSFLAAACQLDGIDEVALGYWLLHGVYGRNPGLFDPDVKGSYYYNWAHPDGK